MGVDNATACGIPATMRGPSGYAVSTLRRGRPEDYFHRLALDTLQVTVKGHFRNLEDARALLAKRKQAECSAMLGPTPVLHTAHDGHRLHVLPHGGRPAYQLLMRDGDGMEIRAFPTSNMPAFIVRFGARWCVERSVVELGEWVAAFVRSVGFEPHTVALSEVHIRCDVPDVFTEADVKGMRGIGTRNGRFNTHVHLNRLSGVDNLGGKKSIKFVLYDKRLEQTIKQGVLWPSVWHSYGIPITSPIWRIEARWDRKSLQAVGLDALHDLDERRIKGLWHLFASRYLLFVEEEDKRTDRATVLPKWAAVQACGELMATAPIASTVDVTPSQLLKQATGCIAKAMAVSGLAHAKTEIEAVVAQAIEAAQDKLRGERVKYVRKLLLDVVERYPDDAFSSVRVVSGEIKDAMAEALSRKVFARPYTAPESSSLQPAL